MTTINYLHTRKKQVTAGFRPFAFTETSQIAELDKSQKTDTPHHPKPHESLVTSFPSSKLKQTSVRPVGSPSSRRKSETPRFTVSKIFTHK